jgi:hypothetical protein
MLGRRVLVGLVTTAVALSLVADAVACVVGGRVGEATVYFVAAGAMGFVGFSIESVKRFLGE